MTELNLHRILNALELTSVSVRSKLAVVQARAKLVSQHLDLELPPGCEDLQSYMYSLRNAIEETLVIAQAQQERLELMLEAVPEYWNSADRPKTSDEHKQIRKFNRREDNDGQ